MLIGDWSGLAIIAHTYGDVRPDHLLKQAQRIRLTVQTKQDGTAGASSTESSITLPGDSASFTATQQVADTANAQTALSS